MKPDTYREHLTDLQVEIEELKAQLAVQPKPPENGSISAKTADNRDDRTTGDTISRQAAIDALMEAFCDTMIESICKDTIEALPSAQPEQQWIPCSEKLPDYDGCRTLTTINTHVRSGHYYKGVFYNDNGDTWKATDKEVIAWKPSPEPYAERVNNELV